MPRIEPEEPAAIPAERVRPRLVSVVVPVRDAADHLAAQLEALTRQEHSGDWEVAIAENDSRDRSVEVARGWLDRLPSPRLRRAPGGRGPTHARNTSAAAARRAFLD